MRVDRETWQSYISYALNANVAVILWIPREDTASTGCTMLSYEDRAQSTEHRGVFTGNHPLPIQLYQMETIIACKNNSYKCSIKEHAKDDFVEFFDNFHPPTQSS